MAVSQSFGWHVQGPPPSTNTAPSGFAPRGARGGGAASHRSLSKRVHWSVDAGLHFGWKRGSAPCLFCREADLQRLRCRELCRRAGLAQRHVLCSYGNFEKWVIALVSVLWFRFNVYIVPGSTVLILLGFQHFSPWKGFANERCSHKFLLPGNVCRGLKLRAHGQCLIFCT